MCGRFSLTIWEPQIVARFGIKQSAELKPNYNISPGQNVAVILNSSPEKISFAKWGLMPKWLEHNKTGLINARAETIKEKPAFKDSYLNKRCLILADSFYEWKKSGELKIPYRIMLKDNQVFAFAGLWNTFEKDGEIRNSCAIITTGANEIVRKIHERMPVILDKAGEKQWLGRASYDLLQPYSSEFMKAYPISNLVNNPKNNTEEVIKPVRTL